jgi:hypothetical protein
MNDTIATFADRDRRTVLSCLDERRGTVDIQTLAADVVAERESTGPDRMTDAEHEAVLVRLHHVDLPKLDAAGFLDFDHETGAVDRRGRVAPTSSTLSA